MVSGLQELREIAKQSQTSNSGGAGDFGWFKLSPDSSARVRFLQELDGDSKYARQDKGLAVVLFEHTDPDNFRKKMKCSITDEGKCFGCEQYKANPKSGWKRKSRLYAAVLVKTDSGNEVQIISQTTSSRSIFNTLLEYAEEYGAITDRPWKITRNGDGKDTSYAAVAFDREPEGFNDFDDYEVPDLEKVATRTFPYDEQAAFFNDGAMDVSKVASDSDGGWANDKKGDSPLSGW